MLNCNEIFSYFAQTFLLIIANSGAASNHFPSNQQENNPGVIQPFK